MENEKRQLQKFAYCRIPIIEDSRNHILEMESRLVVAGGVVEGVGWVGSRCGHGRAGGGTPVWWKCAVS